jgi:pyruvate kinase
MAIYWGITPLMIKQDVRSTRELVYYSIKTAYNKKELKKSDRVVVTAAHPFNIRGKTNLIELHTVNEILKRSPSAK